MATDRIHSTFVTGQVDTMKLKNGNPIKDYLTLNDSASLTGIDGGIMDFEVLVSRKPPEDSGVTPEGTISQQNMGVLPSIGVEFSKSMNKQSVEENLTVLDREGNNVPSMFIWFHNYLHLIPDGSTEGLNDFVGILLPAESPFSVHFGPGIMDVWNWELSENTVDV